METNKIELLKKEEIENGFPLFLAPNYLEEIVIREVREVELNNDRIDLYNASKPITL